MKIITPKAVTTANLTSNVPVTETAWMAGTYTAGQQVYIANHDMYEAQTTTTDEPTVGAAKETPTWLRIGKTNRFAMFDAVLGTSTTKSDGITVTIAGSGQIANGLALFGVSGDSVTVTVTDPVDGVIYTATRETTDNSGVYDWWSWYFSPIVENGDMVFVDLPLYGTASITVEITGNAVCGEMVLGLLRDIGTTTLGTSVSIIDYSRKDRDTFGNAILIQRAFARRANYDVAVDTGSVGAVTKALAAVRAVPTVYIGDADRPETVVYGFYRDFGITLSTPVISECSIEVEGLV